MDLITVSTFFFVKDDGVAAIAFLGKVIKYTCFGYGNIWQVYFGAILYNSFSQTKQPSEI